VVGFGWLVLGGWFWVVGFGWLVLGGWFWVVGCSLFGSFASWNITPSEKNKQM